MKQSIWTVNAPSNPQAFITKRKQRIKQFDGQVFLNDGDEYEIEIFNPTPSFVLAKIKIDKDYLSGGGIVLRPGERVFLERFLDTNNKFVFRTYEVGKEAINLGATDNNGYVEIQFFNEYKATPNYWSGGYGTITTSSSGNWLGGATYTTNTTGINTNTFYNTSLTSTSNFNNDFNIKSVLRDNDVSNQMKISHLSARKVETGLTEKGDESKQTFTQSNKEFVSYSFWNVAWRILPSSHKQYHKEELNTLYCGECGAKRKKDTHKFCPHCGTKF